jgi:hypothetical protein
MGLYGVLTQTWDTWVACNVKYELRFMDYHGLFTALRLGEALIYSGSPRVWSKNRVPWIPFLPSKEIKTAIFGESVAEHPFSEPKFCMKWLFIPFDSLYIPSFLA